MLPASVNNFPILIFGAVIDIETGTKHAVIFRQYFRNCFGLVDVTASLPAHLDFLQTDDIGTLNRLADSHEVIVPIQAPTELNIVTDDVHPLFRWLMGAKRSSKV